jgi:hypothetical protein
VGRVGERIRVVEKRPNPNSKVRPVVTRSRFSAHLLQSSLLRKSSKVSGSHPAFRPEWQANTPAKTIQRKLRTRDQACTLTRQRIVGRDAAIGLAVFLTKMAVFGTAAVLTAELALLGLVVWACMTPGAYPAKFLLRHMPLRVHAALIDAVVLAGGGVFRGRALAA